ncbi:MAG: substrate binding domain-containing protein, partial [Pseudomonadota bacterium]
PARDSDLVGVKLMNTRYRVCASPGYLARTTAALDDPADLARHPCLRFRFAPFDVRWLTRANETAEILEIPVDGPLLASNALALQDAARAGLGPALLADWLVAEDVAAGALVELFPTYEFTATTWDTAAWALYPSKAYLPWKTRATLDWLKAALRNPAA